MAKRGTSLIDLEEAFQSENDCHAYLEAIRWPNGVRCLKCGGDRVKTIITNDTKRMRFSKKQGKAVEVRVPGRRLYQCNSAGCRHQFSATTGTLFTDTHLPLKTWFKAVALICNAKKGISALQTLRDLGVHNKTAWFLNHRIREAMQQEGGIFGGQVEMDETYVSRVPETGLKQPIIGVFQRKEQDQPAKIQTFPIPNRSRQVLAHVVSERVAPDAKIFTDEWSGYRHLKHSHDHAIVIHSKGEYVNGLAHTNNLESFWGVFKRGLIGSFHFVSVKHLQRYLNEFAFRFNNKDAEDLFLLVVVNLVIGSALRYKVLIAEPAKTSPALPEPSPDEPF